MEKNTMNKWLGSRVWLAVVWALAGCDSEEGATVGQPDTMVLTDLGDSTGDTFDTPDTADSDVPDTAPADTTLTDTITPTDTTPADTIIPTDTTPADTTPADTTPADTTPADTTPTDTTSPPPDPATTGPVPFTDTEVEVAGFDATWYLPTSAADVPAIVLAPGFSLEAATLQWLANHLASHGFAVLLIDFGDSPFAPLTHDALGTAMVEAVTWMAADARVDTSRLAVGGHSRGGKAAMLAAARDTRIEAVLGLDPVDAPPPFTQPGASYPSVTPELMGQVGAALLLVGSEYGPTPVNLISPACAPADDNFEQYAQNASAASRVVTEEIPKSGHNDFADPLPGLLAGACKAGDAPATTRARVKVLAVSFLSVVLRGDSRYESFL